MSAIFIKLGEADICRKIVCSIIHMNSYSHHFSRSMHMFIFKKTYIHVALHKTRIKNVQLKVQRIFEI